MQAIRVGERMVTTRRVTQEQINAYAAASGDHNPLHVDPDFAARTPLGGTVAHGMLVLAWLSALLTERFGAAWTRHGSLRIRFRAPARPGDVLDISATVHKIADDDQTIQLVLLVSNQQQEPVVDGQATVTIAARS